MELSFLDRLQSNSERVIDANGFLRIPGLLARSGIYKYPAGSLPGFEDREPGEMISVFRPHDEVRKVADKYGDLPVTNDHPSSTLMNPQNARDNQVGHVSAQIKIEDIDDDVFIRADIVVTAEDAINAIKKMGKSELSGGQRASIRRETGETPKGEPFEAVQFNLIPNHVAIVQRGRAGQECRLADNHDNQEKEAKAMADKDDEDKDKNKSKDKSKSKHDDESKSGDNADIEKLNAKVQSQLGQIDSLKDVNKTLTSENDDLKKFKDSAEKKPDADIKPEIKADPLVDVLKVYEDAKTMCGDSFSIEKVAEPTVISVKRAALIAKCGDKMAEKTDDYIDARFDGMADMQAQKVSKENVDIGDSLTEEIKSPAIDAQNDFAKRIQKGPDHE